MKIIIIHYTFNIKRVLILLVDNFIDNMFLDGKKKLDLKIK